MKMAKRARTTKKQISTLVDYIENNKSMIYSSKTHEDGREIEKNWTELKTILNQVGGPVKSTKQWKNVSVLRNRYNKYRYGKSFIINFHG